MKKILAIAGFLTLPWAAASLQAVDNATVDIVMSIQSIDVTGLKVFDAVATDVAASKVVRAGSVPGRAVYTNTSNVSEDFSVRIASTSGSWTPFTGTTAVPQDQYRLRAVWAGFFASTMGLVTSDFNDNDILTGSNQLSSSTVFFSESSAVSKVGTPAANGGAGIPVTGVGDNARHLFFRFDSGASGTSGTSTAWVNVTATATP